MYNYYPNPPLNNPNSFNYNFTPSTPLIDQQQTNNQHNTIHDNLKDNIKNETIKEYQITVDTIDRNIVMYPNPYSFKLTMGNNIEMYTPNLNRMFRNVKYLKIDSVIMPISYNDNKLTNERFILLQLNNINSSSQLGTNTALNKPSIILYPRKEYGNYCLFKPVNKNTSIIYTDNNNLINLSNIDFNFLDGSYNKLELTDKENVLSVEKQIIINIRIGVYENTINTEVNYR